MKFNATPNGDRTVLLRRIEKTLTAWLDNVEFPCRRHRRAGAHAPRLRMLV